MDFPLSIKANREETPLAGSAVLSVLRIQASLETRQIFCGFVFATPTGVRYQSPQGSRFQPVIDLTLVARSAAALGAAVFAPPLAGRALRTLLHRPAKGASHDD